LTAIIGVAFCLGALTALWAARPWDRAARSEQLAARSNDTSLTGAPVGSVGTYGETYGRADAARPGAEPAPPPSDAPAGGSSARGRAVPPAARGTDAAAAPPADLLSRDLVIPVQGVTASELQPTFHAERGARTHEAIDVLAPRGTPVLAAEAGEIAKLFYSIRGGKTIYQFERSGRYCYYYAHLDSYARGLKEGRQVREGEVIGYVGSSGNADEDAPHLHFAIFKLGPEKRWWEGTPIDPYPLLARR
jgi:murein DD-endopeptidase MepM/ murein hydrolase activator NlpD